MYFVDNASKNKIVIWEVEESSNIWHGEGVKRIIFRRLILGNSTSAREGMELPIHDHLLFDNKNKVIEKIFST